MDWINNIFDEENLKMNVQFAALFVLNYECLKDFVVNQIRDFYSDDVIENVRWVHKESDKYKREVRTLSKYVDDASMQWFLKSEAITEEDYKVFQTARIRRNEITHQFLQNIGNGFEESDVELFGKLLSLYRKIDKWWINEIEIPISGDYIQGNYDQEDVIGGQAMILSAVNEILLGNQGEYYKQLLEKLQKYCNVE